MILSNYGYKDREGNEVPNNIIVNVVTGTGGIVSVAQTGRGTIS